MSVVTQVSSAVRIIPTGIQTTTLNTSTAITGLSVPVAANASYSFNGMIHVGCNNTGGVKFDATIPASATLFLSFDGSTTSTTAIISQNVVASATLTGTAICQENNQNRKVYVSGTVTTGATSGNVVIGFASGTATQTSTIYVEGSFINVIRLS